MRLALFVIFTFTLSNLTFGQASPSTVPPIPSADPPPASLESSPFLSLALVLGMFLFYYFRSRVVTHLK